MNYKIIVAHSAQQHSFRTATALKKSGNLYKYITTVYDRDKSITSKLKKILKGDNLTRASSRRCDQLDDNEILQFNEISALFLLLLNRIDKKRYLYNFIRRYIVYKFNIKVARYAIKNNVDAVIMYDNDCEKAFEILKNKEPRIKRIMDISSANRLYRKDLYSDDILKCGEFKELYTEKELIISKKLIKQYENELLNTDYFIAPSKFVKDSLIYSNIDEKKIKVIPYGVDSDVFRCKDFNEKKIDTIKFLYVGGIKQYKGIYYLLEAFSKINHPKVELTVVGTTKFTEKFEKSYSDYCNFVNHIPKKDMPELYKNHHVLIMPSLAEGLSLSILEAMSSGLPVIATVNSGTKEIIKDGYNGFNIKIQNIEDIMDKINWFINNTDKINDMGSNARKTANILSWERYYEGINIETNNILKQTI